MRYTNEDVVKMTGRALVALYNSLVPEGLPRRAPAAREAERRGDGAGGGWALAGEVAARLA